MFRLLATLSFAVFACLLFSAAVALQGYKTYEANLVGSPTPVTVFAKDYFDAKDQIHAQFCQGRDFNSCVSSGPREKH